MVDVPRRLARAVDEVGDAKAAVVVALEAGDRALTRRDADHARRGSGFLLQRQFSQNSVGLGVNCAAVSWSRWDPGDIVRSRVVM